MVIDSDANLSKEKRGPVDYTAEFSGLADDEAFARYMYKGYDSFGLTYKQGAMMRGDSRYMPGLDDFFLFRGVFEINEAIAEMYDNGEEYHMVFSFSAGGQNYTLTCSKNGATLRMQGYDDSELVYHLDTEAVVKFLLGIVHVNTGTDNPELTALPDDFSTYKEEDKIKTALSMLGEVSGLTSIEHKKSAVRDDIDSSFIISLVEASGINFDTRAVIVDMDWQLVEGKYTYVSVRSDERMKDGKPEYSTSGLRAPIEVSHLDFPFLHKLGLLDPISGKDCVILNPQKDYELWASAVNTVMSRLIRIYSQNS